LSINKTKRAKFKTRNGMTEQEMINLINKIDGIGGMTVNERLFVSGLDDEFGKALQNDKNKAKKILELLRVDKASIEIIVSE
jgi:hypothetical protein